MEKEIIQTLKYFSLFSYPPTAEEIYIFLPKKLEKQCFLGILEKLTKQRLITIHRFKKEQFGNSDLEFSDYPRYTLGEYGIKKSQISNLKTQNFQNRYEISQNKLNSPRFKLYIKLISLFPQIKLVGLSGTLAMMNAKEEDDIDLFIITAKNRLFTGRLIAVIIASLLHIRRIRPIRPMSPVSLIKNKLCLNLFFDESDLCVPKFKKTAFVGHEILQMKPLIVKGDVYEQFLKANRWVFSLFPNAKFKISSQFKKLKIKNLSGSSNLGFRISNKIESYLKSLQLRLINKHKTSEIITARQLWFHPQDYNLKNRSW